MFCWYIYFSIFNRAGMLERKIVDKHAYGLAISLVSARMSLISHEFLHLHKYLIYTTINNTFFYKYFRVLFIIYQS